MPFVLQDPNRPLNGAQDAQTVTTGRSDMIGTLPADDVDVERERRIDLALSIIQSHQDEEGVWGEAYSTL